MKPLPKFVESGWLHAGRESDPDRLAMVVLTVDVDGVWHLVQRWKTGWCQTETSRHEYPDEEQARAHLAKVYAAGVEHGRWKVRTA